MSVKELLASIRVTETTLPNTNTFDWAKRAQFELFRNARIESYICLDGDDWVLEIDASLPYLSGTVMNVPVRRHGSNYPSSL